MENQKSLEEQYLEKLLAERQELDTLINAIQKKQGQTTSSDIGQQKDVHLQHDSFYGMSILEAAKKYLMMVGKPARSIQFILDNLNKGGLNSPYSAVSGVLARAARKEGGGIANPTRGHYGLEEWYGNSGRRIRNKDKEDAPETQDNGDTDGGETETK